MRISASSTTRYCDFINPTKIYLVHAPWLKQWRAFVKMKLIKRGYVQVVYEAEELERDYPGPITNEALFKDFSRYLREDDATDPTNFQVRTKAYEGKDYKLVPKACWEVLRQRFQGTEIIRFKDSDSYTRKYNIKFFAVPLLVLPPVKQLDPAALKEQKKQKMYVQFDSTFKQVKEKLARIAIKMYPDFNLSVENIRLWKSHMNLSKPASIADFLTSHTIGGPDTLFK